LAFRWSTNFWTFPPASAVRRWSQRAMTSTSSAFTISTSSGSGAPCNPLTSAASPNGTISAIWQSRAGSANMPGAAMGTRRCASCMCNPGGFLGQNPRAISACCPPFTTWTVLAMIRASLPRLKAQDPVGLGCWTSGPRGGSRLWMNRRSGFSMPPSPLKLRVS